MFKKFLIDKINKEFSGKELMFCDKLYSDIMFMPENVRTCCFSTKMPYNPPVLFKKAGKIFSRSEYLLNIYNLMKKNQGKNAPCEGCKFLKKQIVPWFHLDERITFLTINHFTKCNSDCIYCIYGDIVNKSAKKPYKMLPIVSRMFEKNMISPRCLINWGGGEPTIYDEFPALVNFFHKKGIRQAVNSSGLVFSPEVWDGLKDGLMSIQISPDAGSAENYFKIKRRYRFDDVWKNIEKYSAFPDMLFVKYIFFSLTADEIEVRKFIEKCCETGVKNIVIDCESESANNPNGRFGDITEEIVDLAVLMKHLAVEKGLNYQISYQWREEHRNKIETA